METKKCCTCHRTLPMSDFYKASKTKDGLQNSCKTCKRSYNTTYRKNRRTTTMKLINEIKSSNGCAYCGESDPCCLDFHHPKHRKGSREEQWVSVMVRWLVSWERILTEINKCETVCASCHRKLHAGRNLTRIVNHSLTVSTL